MVYAIVKPTLVPLIKLWVRKISGLQNLKKEKSFIFASNHGSFAEDLVLPIIIIPYLNKLVHIYCNDRFYKNRFLRKILQWGQCIPIRVDDTSEDAKRMNKEAFALALKYLKKNEPVGIFPEGHRSLDGNLMEAKTGVAKLALTAKVPVIPIGAIGTYGIWPKGKRLPRLKRCDINIGEPIYLNKYFGKENNKKVLKEVTTLIMEEIAKLAKLRYNY